MKRILLCLTVGLGLFLLLWMGGYPGPNLRSVPAAVEKRPVTLLLGGDVYVGERMESVFTTNSPAYYLEGLQPILKNVDLHLANLEAPLSPQGDTIVKKQYQLRSSPEAGSEILNQLGVDGVNLANNHILDYGQSGLSRTKQILNHLSIKYTGAGDNQAQASQPAVFELNGQRIGFVGFSNTFPREYWADKDSPGSVYGAPEQVRETVEQTSEDVDFTIASFHWGDELDTKPKTYQRQLAKLAVNSGADVVFGHHPHTIQSFETIQGKPVFYSLGNYYFTTMSKDVGNGLLVKLNLDKTGVEPINYHVINVNNIDVGYRPELVDSFASPRSLAAYLKRPEFHLASGE